MRFAKINIIQILFSVILLFTFYFLFLLPSLRNLIENKDFVDKKKMTVLVRNVQGPTSQKVEKAFNVFTKEINDIYSHAFLNVENQFELVKFLEIKAKEYEINQGIIFDTDKKITQGGVVKAPLRIDIEATINRLADYLEVLERSDYYIEIQSVVLKGEVSGDNKKIKAVINAFAYYN